MVLTIGAIVYVDWNTIGAAFRHLQHGVTTAQALADEQCSPPDKSANNVWGLYKTPGLDAIGYCAPGRETSFLASHGDALRALADQQNSETQAASTKAAEGDIGRAVRQSIPALVIGIAAFILAPLIGTAVRRN